MNEEIGRKEQRGVMMVIEGGIIDHIDIDIEVEVEAVIGNGDIDIGVGIEIARGDIGVNVEETRGSGIIGTEDQDQEVESVKMNVGANDRVGRRGLVEIMSLIEGITGKKIEKGAAVGRLVVGRAADRKVVRASISCGTQKSLCLVYSWSFRIISSVYGRQLNTKNALKSST
jgi:hypothetical protein